MKDNLSKLEVENEINLTNNKLKEDQKALNLWNRIKITPNRWEQKQYPEIENFWVVGLLGQQCLYFNFVEGGWGWGYFEKYGKIVEYHSEQDEIFHTVYKTLFTIEYDDNKY